MLPRVTRRVLTIVLLVLPSLALAQEPVDFPEEKIRCLRTELTEAGFTLGEVDDLFTGRIEDPESFVKGRIGEEGMLEIARTCFPEALETPSPSPRPPGEEIILTPEQRACVTQYIDEGLLDQILRREINPEGVLSRERIEEIGRACFAEDIPPPPPGERAPVPSPLDLPPEILACLTRAVGEQAVREVSSGQRSPTPEEYAKGEKCFPKRGPGGSPAGVPDLPETTKQCIRSIIGDKFDRAMELARTGGHPESLLTPDEMRRVGEQCFGGPAGGPPGGPPGGGPPPEVLACAERVLGKERVAQLLRGAGPTKEEMDQVADAGCFPKGPPGREGPPGPVPQLPPEMEACLRDALGAERLTALKTGRAYATPDELPKIEKCFDQSSSPPPGARGGPPELDLEQCAAECVKYVGPDGQRYSDEQCRQLCSGQPPQPQPTASPPPGPPGGGYDQCLEQCKTYEGGRYNAGDFCERACRGEPVQPPGGEPTPLPTSEPTPYPTPDTAQCVASCTGQPKTTDAAGNVLATYSAEECQGLCGGGTVQGTATAREKDPWWLRLLLRAVGL